MATPPGGMSSDVCPRERRLIGAGGGRDDPRRAWGLNLRCAEGGRATIAYLMRLTKLNQVFKSQPTVTESVGIFAS